MSADGDWIAYTQNNGGGTCNPAFVMAMIRVDGSKHRIVLDQPQLWQILPNGTFPFRMSLTSDDSTLYWWWPHKTTPPHCSASLPLRTYRVDTSTSVVEELYFNGQPINSLSHSDDGQILVFKGWHEPSQTWHWYRSGPDPSTAVEFLDPAPWSTTFGKVCGDGSRFAMIGYHPGLPGSPGDVYVYDFARARLDIVSPFPVEFLWGLDISGDGGRIAYAGSSPIYGVGSDGTGFHEISPFSSGGSATLTRDGNWVIHVHDDPGGPNIAKTRRTAWDGSATETIEGWTPFILSMFHSPVNADGSVVPVLTDPPGGGALSVWFEHLPVLTTYGLGTPGSFIRWDIGGEPGGMYLLLYAFGGASIPVGTKGTLKLDPASLQVLVAGTIGGPPYDIGSLSLTIPADAIIPTPIDVHSQALVFGAAGRNATLTNATVFEITSGAAAMSAGGEAPPGVVVDEGHPWGPLPAWLSGTAPNPEDRERWRALMDPNYARIAAER